MAFDDFIKRKLKYQTIAMYESNQSLGDLIAFQHRKPALAFCVECRWRFPRQWQFLNRGWKFAAKINRVVDGHFCPYCDHAVVWSREYRILGEEDETEIDLEFLEKDYER